MAATNPRLGKITHFPSFRTHTLRTYLLFEIIKIERRPPIANFVESFTNEVSDSRSDVDHIKHEAQSDDLRVSPQYPPFLISFFITVLYMILITNKWRMYRSRRRWPWRCLSMSYMKIGEGNLWNRSWSRKDKDGLNEVLTYPHGTAQS